MVHIILECLEVVMLLGIVIMLACVIQLLPKKGGQN